MALLLLGTPALHAVDVTLTADDPSGTNSFSAAGKWSPIPPAVVPAAPSSGNDYFVNQGFQIRTPTSGSPTFLGKSLTLGDGTTSAQLLLKTAGTVTINDLRMDNGTIANGNTSSTQTVSGSITLLSGGGTFHTVDVDRTLVINSNISGSGALSLGGGGTIILNGTSSYTGGTSVGAATAKLGSSTAFGASFGSLNLNNASAVLDLNNFNQTVGALSGLAGSKITNTLTGSQILTVGSGKLIGDSSTYAGIIQNGAGTVGLTKTGAGTQTLTGNNTYTGGTLVSGGTLVISGSGSINGGAVTVDGGTLNYSSSANLTAALTFTSGTLAGTNYTGKTLSIGANQTISPGNSTGTLTSAALTWAPGGTYQWQINDATGAAGGNGWDLLNTGTLILSATAGSKFNINVVSLSSQLPGAAANFDPAQNYAWLIADAASAITTFDASAFALNLAGFQNANDGIWSVALGGTGGIGGDSSQIYLTYSAIPEPATAGLLFIGLACALFRSLLSTDGSSSRPCLNRVGRVR